MLSYGRDYAEDGTPTGMADSGARILDDLAETLARFVAFPSPACMDAVTLWTAHTHAVDAFESTPRLALLSPEASSGKTRTLEVLELLVPAPMHVLNASTAAVFRSIEAERPTLLFDEVDAIFGRTTAPENEDLRGLLNAGHRRGATIPRCVGKTMEVKRFPVYSALALAGLGDLPDTLMSRSVIVRMRRRSPDELVEPFRYRLAQPELHALRDRLAAWVESVRARLETVWPELPEGVTDRPADCWEPLLAIADAAGGTWVERGRIACVELCLVAANREASLGVRLLADLREIFGDADHLPTETILTRLYSMDEAPWCDLRGRPLDARGLAYRLRSYEVRSAKVRVSDRTSQGYRRSDLWDVWARYLPPTADHAGSLSVGPEHPEQPEHRRSEATESVPPTGPVPEHPEHARTQHVPAVPEHVERPERIAPPLTCTVPDVPDVPALRREGQRAMFGDTSTCGVAQVAQVALPGEIGPCTRCGAATRRYGDAGHPFCSTCRTPPHDGAAAGDAPHTSRAGASRSLPSNLACDLFDDTQDAADLGTGWSA